MKVNRQQKGIALLMAILIVALVSIISVQMITNRQLQIYRTSNLYFHDQAYQYSIAVERWALSALQQDYEKDKKESSIFDSHEDIWNTALVNFDVEQATISGNIFDLQGRLNLNNLVKEGKVEKRWLAVYKRLLTELELPQSLAETLVDWMDENEQPMGSSGAEDVYYIALEQPYRAANQPLAHISELFLVKGYKAEIVESLKPYVYVAPEISAININTSLDKVLRAVVPGLLLTQAEDILSTIETEPFKTVDGFLKHASIKDKAIEPGLISVTSNYFVANSFIEIDKSKVNLQSLIYRDEQGFVQVVLRQQSIEYEKAKQTKQAEEDE